jgi:hypothetical protein
MAPTFGVPDALPDAVDTRPTQMEPEPAPQPVATAGIRRAVNIEGSALGGPAGGATFRQASSLIEPGGFSPRVEEVPDDHVAPQPRRDGEAYAGSAVAAATADAIVASAPRQPVTIAAPAPPAVSPAVATVAVADETRVAQVLNQYARAYGQLDASAAHKVWPTVDERALARAFASLQSQSVSFDDCDVNVSGTSATASCRGRASYVGKVGNREPRTEARQWTFQLRRGDDDAWQIQQAAVR